MRYDPLGKLSPVLEGWLALGINHGGAFASAAAHQLIAELPHDDGCRWETRVGLLLSAMARGDFAGCRRFVNDWRYYRPDRRPAAVVAKWIPGDHYHALNERFDTLEEAVAHLERNGYRFDGLRERFVYKDGN